MGVLLKAFGRTHLAPRRILRADSSVLHRGLRFRIFSHQFPKRRVILPGRRSSELLISQYAEYQDKRKKDNYPVKH